MGLPDLRAIRVTDHNVRMALQTGQAAEATGSVRARTAAGLSELALLDLAGGKPDIAFQWFQEALRLFPESELVFHNGLAAFWSRGLLRGRILTLI